MSVRREQVARGTDALPGLRAQQLLEQRQVVLALVDRVLRPSGRRPADAHLRQRLRARGQLVEAGEPALRGTQRLQHVEGGNARARLVQVQTRVREHDDPRRRPDGEPQREPLACQPLRVRHETAKWLARGVEQDRIFDDVAREQLLRQPWHKHNVEREPARRVGRCNVHAAVAPLRRRLVNLLQAALQHEPDLLQCHRTDRCHGRELGQNGENAFGLSQGTGRESGERVEPLPPARARGQRV